ncbi:MAG: Preprotein translocase subunit E, partial [Microgenomates group bacterium GW2011_GWB1_40_9]
LKKTTWPTRQETIKLTVIVIALSLIVGAFIGVLDTIFLRISGLLFRR